MTRPTVLVVEDEFIVAFELKVALEGMGFTVCGMVNSGEDAIDCVERERPDCVLMDVSLRGGMDGIEAARHIRARFGTRTAFISGYPVEELAERAADVRPLGIFVKPLDYQELEIALGSALLSGAADLN